MKFLLFYNQLKKKFLCHKLINPTLKIKPIKGETITKLRLSAIKNNDQIKKYGRTISLKVDNEYLLFNDKIISNKIKYLNFQNRYSNP